MTSVVATVNILSTTKGSRWTSQFVQSVADLQELFGLHSLTVNGAKIPTTCWTDLFLRVKESSQGQKSPAKPQLKGRKINYTIIDDISLQQDINYWRDNENMPPVEWVWTDDQ